MPKVKFCPLKLLGLFLAFFLLSVLFFRTTKTFAITESDCLNKSPSQLSPAEMDECINNIIPKIAEAYAPAQEKNKADLEAYKKQLASIQTRLAALNKSLKETEKEILQREIDLGVQEELLAARLREMYKRDREFTLLTLLFSSKSVTDFSQGLALRQTAAQQDWQIITVTSQRISTLNQDKETLEKNQKSLASLQAQIDKQAEFLAGEVAKVDSYLSLLSKKQQELLEAKSGSFIASVGDSELADDYNASIKGFRESAPAGSFAVFSFGAYTHRKGMSQYGARGRAVAGQDYRQILKAYYGKEPVSKDTGGTISVAGIGNVDFENYYMMGIAEMPSNWDINALKAQAVAARTYAYRYKVEGKSICTTEDCQVFRRSKADSPPAAWKQAVEETRGQVLEEVVTYYSSTTGGYITTMGWDTTDGGGGGNFFDKSYEKIGGSPWAYKAWYRKGYTASGATCGVDDPWLTNEEFTDIVNAALVLRNGADSRVTSTSTSCWGGNPYSYAELRAKGGVNSVTSVSVIQGTGMTNEVVINGSIHLTGAEFKQAFNLRAPGYLMIPQKGFVFFNIERK